MTDLLNEYGLTNVWQYYNMITDNYGCGHKTEAKDLFLEMDSGHQLDYISQVKPLDFNEAIVTEMDAKYDFFLNLYLDDDSLLCMGDLDENGDLAPYTDARLCQFLKFVEEGWVTHGENEWLCVHDASRTMNREDMVAQFMREEQGVDKWGKKI